jgi:diphosphomevalonate decarboxylase
MTNPFSPYNIKKIIATEPFGVGWQCPSNIALIKYWGKKELQLPLTPSLSLTLDRANTQTRLHVSFDGKEKGLISVNGDKNHAFLPKMQQLFAWMMHEVPVLSNITIEAETRNSFPHSTGIASSASGLSAFSMCMVGIIERISGIEFTEEDFFRIASYASRMGSGSACRSVYGGYTVWGSTASVPGSSDEHALPVNDLIHPGLKELKDAILIISSVPKSLSSSLGHQAMNHHPYLTGRIIQANKNLDDILHALKNNDLEHLAVISENEAMSLHALMMSANPGTILLREETIDIIGLVRDGRKKGVPVFFTMDAGANVHVLYPQSEAQTAEKFIRESLLAFCEDGRSIMDGCGAGPKQLN